MIKIEIAAPNSTVNKLGDIFDKPPTIKPQAEMITPEDFRIKTTTNPGEVEGIAKGGNAFERRAKKTLSGVAPDEQVVNALKNEFYFSYLS